MGYAKPYPKPEKQPKKAKKRIPKTSAKRKAQLVIYRPLRKRYLLDHPKCEIKLIGCTGKSTQIHHTSMSDLDFLNTKTWKATCDGCHDQTERVLSAVARRAKGLLI